MKLIAIDPTGCGCTECLVGEYLPLERVEKDHVLALAKGDLQDNTSEIASVTYTNYDGVEIYLGGRFYSFPDESFETLPPANLRFENFSITIESQIMDQVKYRLY